MPAIRTLAVAFAISLLAPAAASADATVESDAPLGIVNVVGDDAPDAIQVTQGADSLLVARAGGGLVAAGHCTGGGALVTCPPARLLSVDLAGGDDVFSPVAVTVPVSVRGGAGNDTLIGGAGADVLVGDDGDDRIGARDAMADTVLCGIGDDRAETDATDFAVGCEADRGGRVAGPGVRIDADRDGIAAPLDCNDADAAIRPGALEVRGNRVDENCDGRVSPRLPVAAAVTNQWALDGSRTRLRALVVRLAPRGAGVTVSCRGGGCPVERTLSRIVGRDLAPVSFTSLFRRARLRSGARVTVTISAPETLSRVYTFTAAAGALPDPRLECRAPRARKGTSC